MHISQNIKTIRKKFGWTQMDLSKKLELTKGQIQTYERDKATPSVHFFMKLEEITGIPIYDLISREVTLDEVPPSPLTSRVQPKTKGGKKNIDQLINEVDRIRKELEDLKGD